MYRVLLERAAEKELSRLSSEIHDRVIAAIQALRRSPRPPGCRKLAGSKNDWRIRVGDYRVFTKSPTTFASCASTACAIGAKFIADRSIMHPSTFNQLRSTSFTRFASSRRKSCEKAFVRAQGRSPGLRAQSSPTANGQGTGPVTQDAEEDPAQAVAAMVAAGEALDSRPARETVWFSRPNGDRPARPAPPPPPAGGNDVDADIPF
jgi:mRNA interferase RelE/StbE